MDQQTNKPAHKEAPLRVAIAGAGYVGMSMAVLLARRHRVVITDINATRIAMIQAGRSPIADTEIEAWLAGAPLNLAATSDPVEAYAEADIVIVATPTSYDPDLRRFDTSSVVAVIDTVRQLRPSATVVIKSTVPVGLTAAVSAERPEMTILFSPEFLREGRALHDNLYPSRIVVGSTGPEAEQFAQMMLEAAEVKAPVLLTGPSEAEAIKLFANNYLAMRVAWFNELDSWCWSRGVDTGEVIAGICRDPRIGDHYNNPSFGYGGYCLPKDTRQLEADFEGVPQAIISAVVTANALRKRFVADQIMARRPRVVGVYRLAMKAGSDNFRASSIMDVMAELVDAGTRVVVYEPLLADGGDHGFDLATDLETFIAQADVIIANRLDEAITPVQGKVISRDLFGVN